MKNRLPSKEDSVKAEFVENTTYLLSSPILVIFIINLVSFVESSINLNRPLKSTPPFSCELKNTSVAEPRFVLLNFRLPAPG